MTGIRNSDGSYMNPTQIIADMLTRSEMPYSLSWFSTCTYREMQEFLRWIRNSYGMWEQENPYVVINDPANNFEGVRHHELFPDNLSEHISRQYYRRLQELQFSERLDAEYYQRSHSKYTITCKLDQHQVAKLKAYVDDAAASLMSNPRRAPPPTYVRMGVTDARICHDVVVFLDGYPVSAIGADSAMGYVLLMQRRVRNGFWETAFARKNGHVEIRWAE